MRLTGFDTLPSIETALARVRPLAEPWAVRARAGLARLAPYWERLAPYRARIAEEVRKSTTLMAAFGKVQAFWTKLVGAFCETIDPYLSRWFPDIRLVAVVTASGAVELHRTLKRDATFLGPLDAIAGDERAAIEMAKWTAIELRLRPDQVLQRTLSLPAASREFLAPIIEHKLDRLTPWKPDRVLYGYRTVEAAEAGGGVTVALTATSKDLVAAPLAALGALGLAPTAIGATDGPLADPLGINLLRGAAKAARVDSRRLVSRAALASLALLGTITLATSFMASSADDGLREASVRLMKARKLLKSASMGAVGERERALLEAKQPDRATVVLIDRLATAIPETTYLKELSIAPDKVRLVGLSGDAPALVGKLEATGLLNVRFTSAVTREKDQRDSFEITADRVAPAAAEAP